MRFNIAFISMLVLLLAVIAAGCTSKSKAAPAGEAIDKSSFTQNNQGGGVEVSVTRATPEYFKSAGKQEMASQLDLSNRLVFIVAMTTHSGDLRSYQYLNSSELLIDGVKYKPLSWESLSQDSHHPEGFLAFAAKDVNGKPVISSQAKYMKLILRDLNNVPERVFQWQVNN